MNEKKVEAYLKREIKALGGEAYKFSSPNRRFVPDRLCVMPLGVIFFVEVKGPDGKLSSGQEREIDRLQKKGHHVRVVSTFEEVNQTIEIIKEVLDAQ